MLLNQDIMLPNNPITLIIPLLNQVIKTLLNKINLLNNKIITQTLVQDTKSLVLPRLKIPNVLSTLDHSY